MDVLCGSDRKLGDLDDNVDFLVDHDVFQSNSMLSSDQYMDSDWLNSLFEDPVLNDKMITEAVQSPRIQSEHSYSLNNDQSLSSPLGLTRIEDFGKDIDTDIFDSNHGALDLSQKTYNTQIVVKQEPVEMEYNTTIMPQSAPSSLTQPTIIFATSTNPPKHDQSIMPKFFKTEPEDFLETTHDQSGFETVGLPPTPPSSTTTSDSEGSLSPHRSAPPSPVRPLPISKQAMQSKISQPLFTNPIPQSGYLILTDEEKRTLIAEGYPIPSKLPLTKQEEKNLKKIRRKIKNKISAQESRRKKKEYLETLEKRVESFTQENTDLKKKVDSLETNNRSLLSQLHKLQALVGKMPRPSSASSTQTGTVLMVLVLGFAVFLGSWAPTSLNIGYSSPSSSAALVFYSNPRPIRPSPAMGPRLQNIWVDSYSTPSMKSRVLLSLKDDLEDGVYGPDVPQTTAKDVQKDNRPEEEIPSDKLAFGPDLAGVAANLSLHQDEKSVAVDAHLHPANDSVYNLQATMYPDIVTSTNILALEKRTNTNAEIETA